ncbi:hypothetical protein AB1Y20_011048 [Prymnesium parvum]|uniref:RRM domain-containing protein n=1 Tax=Prymnesium parvum TaxID=97485 RepID=A0AB34ILF1_PRYPA
MERGGSGGRRDDRRDERGRDERGRDDRGRDDRGRDDRGRDDRGRRGRDPRREAEERLARGGLLCDDIGEANGEAAPPERGRERRRSPRRYSRSPRRRSRSPRRYSRSWSRSRSPRRRERKKKWDDTGEAAGGESQQALVATMMLAQANQQAALSMGVSPGMMAPVQMAGRKQRELYVGNLTAGVVTGEMLKDFFTSILTQCPGYSPKMGPPVAVVQLSGEGKFAFVEFRDELMAVTALQLDKKVELAGRALNVGRPAGYTPSPAVPMPHPLPLPPGFAPSTDPSTTAAIAGMLATNSPAATTPDPSQGLAELLRAQAAPVGRKQRELYVGNLPVGMVTPQTLKDLFTAPLRTMPGFDESLGPPVTNCDLSADGKFAFVEFRDEPITSIALTLFDKTELCGRTLNVGRPRGYVAPGEQPAAPLLPGLAALTQPPAQPAAPPSTCLRLEGLITDSMLSDDEYEDVLDDIKQECERSGAVADIKIPREGPLKGACFVRFAELAGAAKARESLHMRQFDGNTVTAKFITADQMPP